MRKGVRLNSMTQCDEFAQVIPCHRTFLLLHPTRGNKEESFEAMPAQNWNTEFEIRNVTIVKGGLDATDFGKQTQLLFELHTRDPVEIARGLRHHLMVCDDHVLLFSGVA
jgi:hypothetical protein